ncbi:hypothetical protein ACSNOI_12550 [Actinomadura kijaniata]|uniref:hypothetical protein n=1 Tax=Actinomadura kijaniata TaxID=46161 RepID=UPI003F1C3ADE
MADRLRRVPWRALVALITILTGCGYLWAHRAQVAELALREGAGVPVSLLTACAGTVTGGLAWREVLAALGTPLGHLPALASYHSSQIGKYLPGGVGPVAVQITWSRSIGATPALVMRSYLLSLVLSSASGLAVGGLMMAPRWPLGGGCLAFAGAAASALLLSRHGAAALGAVLRRLPKTPIPAIPVGARWGRAYALMVVGWLLLGLHVGVLLDEPLTGGAAAVGAAICATVLGAFAVVLPGGLGAREGALYWFLTRTATAGPAGVTVALSSRMITLVTDVVLGLVATAVLLHLRRKADTVARPGHGRTPPLIDASSKRTR